MIRSKSAAKAALLIVAFGNLINASAQVNPGGNGGAVQVPTHSGFLGDRRHSPIGQFGEGALLKGSNVEVFVIKSGHRLWISNPDVFNALGYNWSRIITVPDSFLARIPEGMPIVRDGMLIKGAGIKKYVIRDGKRHLIPSEAAFRAFGFDPNKVQVWSDLHLNMIPEGEGLVYKVPSPVKTPALPIVTPRPAEPVLTEARIQFHTGDDDKDYDTSVTSSIICDRATIASASGTYGKFPDHTDSPWIPLNVVEPLKKSAIVGHCMNNLQNSTVGNDDWHFTWTLLMVFSDHTVKQYDFGGLLTQYNNSMSRQL